jgi:Cof subfamily protein (haloacid dehalogenase superfamily)
MTPTIKLIATDLDGTLLNSEHQVSPRTMNALREAIARGIPIVIATGKTYDSATRIIAELGITTPGVFVQGLVLHNADGSVRSSIAHAPDVVRAVADFADAHNIPAVAYSQRRIMCRELHEFIHLLSGYGEPLAEAVGPLGAMAETVPVNKMIYLGSPEQMTEAREALAKVLGDRATLVQALAHMLEILPPGASKGAGVQRLLDDLGIAPENMLAIGDGENDVEMLRMAGIGVAVANAMPHALEAADYIVASNDDDGAAEAIERFVLNSDSMHQA